MAERRCRWCGAFIKSRGMVTTHGGRVRVWIHSYDGDIRCSTRAMPETRRSRRIRVQEGGE